MTNPAWLEGRAVGSTDELSEARCVELVRLLRENRIVRDVPAREDAITVEGQLWQQLPPAVREVAVFCLAAQKGLEPASLEVLGGGGNAQ